MPRFDDHSTFSLQIQRKRRADERTRNAFPCTLRVIGHTLLGLARACKSRIDKPVSLFWLVTCCTVLCFRWCQSGVVPSSFPLSSKVSLVRLRLGCDTVAPK